MTCSELASADVRVSALACSWAWGGRPALRQRSGLAPWEISSCCALLGIRRIGNRNSSAGRFRQRDRTRHARKRIAGVGTLEVRMSCGEFLVGDAFVGCGRDQGVKPNPSAAFHSLMQFLLVNELFYCSL